MDNEILLIIDSIDIEALWANKFFSCKDKDYSKTDKIRLNSA
jgi:hypothetical protein